MRVWTSSAAYGCPDARAPRIPLLSSLRPWLVRAARGAGRVLTALGARLNPPPPPPPPEPEPEPEEDPPAALLPVDYPVTPRPRYGWVDRGHDELTRIVERQRSRYVEVLESFTPFIDQLRQIPLHPATDTQPSYMNGWLPSLDGIALYGFVASRRPATYLEVGSGNSTKWVRQAIADHDLPTRIVSIDPQPRAEIDALCDEVIRQPFEECDLAVFDALQPGDVTFVDNSHRSFMNSDATVAMVEVLPRLPAGVLIGYHDIWIPGDYPKEWVDRWYNEQYLLSTFLIGGHQRYRIELPTWYASYDPELAGGILEPLWASDHLAELVERQGCSFWLEAVAPPATYRSTWIGPDQGRWPGPLEG